MKQFWQRAVLLGLTLALACSDPETRFAEHIESADALAAVSKWDEAVLEYRSALQLDPQNAEANFKLATALEAAQEYANALFFYEEAARLDPDAPDAELAVARMLLGDDTERTKAIVSRLIERFPANPEAHVVRSAVALVEEDLPEALSAALVATELGPENGRNWIALGRARHAMIRSKQLEGGAVDPSEFESALSAFERAREIDGTGSLAGFEYTRLLSVTPGRVDEAGAVFETLLDELPDHQVAMRTEVARVANQYAARRQNPGLMRRTFIELSELQPDNLSVWEQWARLENGIEPGGGENLYRKLLEQQPNNPEAHVRYATYLMKLGGRGADAHAHLRDAAERMPEHAPILLLPVAETSEPAEAERIRQQLVREHPDHPFTELAMIQPLLVENRNKEAAERLRALVTRAEHPDIFRYLAMVELRQRNGTAALGAVRDAIRRTRGFDPALVRLRGKILCQMGNYLGCLRSLKRVFERGYELTEIERVLQAECHYELGRPEVGRSLLDAILAAPNPGLRSVLVFATREIDRDPEAVRVALDAAIERYPRNTRLLRHRARADVALGDLDAALARLDGVIEGQPDDAPLRILRAQLRLHADDLDGAAEDAKIAADLDPDLRAARLILARVYTAQDKLDELVADMEAAEANAPLPPAERFLLGTLHARSGNGARAEELYEKILEVAPNHASAKRELAFLIAERDGDLERALALARDAVADLPGDSDAADTLGLVYLKRGLTEPALSQFDAAIQLTEDDTAAGMLHYHRGLALAALGRRDEATTAIERARAADPELVMELPSELAID